MDMLHEILIGLFSGTSIFGVFEAIRYRRENKRLKAAEAGTAEADTSKAQTEAQKEKMELGDMYLEKVMELTEKSYQATLKNNDDILSTTTKLASKIDSVSSEVQSIVKYLNGEYQDYLRRKKPKRGGGLSPTHLKLISIMENVTEELVRQNGNQAAAVMADYAGQGGGGGSTGGISLNEPQATLTFRQATQSDVAKFSHASNIIAVAEINGIIPVIVTSVDNSGSILVSYFLSTGYFGQNSNTSQLRAMYMGAKANTGNPIITTSSLYISDDGTLFGLAGVSQ